jgi:hypothetical protein
MQVCKSCHNASMVEAEEPFKLHPTSTSYRKNCGTWTFWCLFLSSRSCKRDSTIRRAPAHDGHTNSAVEYCTFDLSRPALNSWLAMSANVSVGYTPQTTDIFVCCRHVGNVVPTPRRHSAMSANFSAVGVVSVRPIADTHSYMDVGISIDEVVTIYKDKKN